MSSEQSSCRPSWAPAGWFADPWRQAPLRWWDGYEWTGYLAPLPVRSDRQRTPWKWTPRVTVISVAVALMWCVLVAVALQSTLVSLRTDDFDGLNNMFQLPLALPWILLPIGSSSHEADAWVVAAMGWFNGLLILCFLDPWLFSRFRRR